MINVLNYLVYRPTLYTVCSSLEDRCIRPIVTIDHRHAWLMRNNNNNNNDNLYSAVTQPKQKEKAFYMILVSKRVT